MNAYDAERSREYNRQLEALIDLATDLMDEFDQIEAGSDRERELAMRLGILSKRMAEVSDRALAHETSRLVDEIETPEETE